MINYGNREKNRWLVLVLVLILVCAGIPGVSATERYVPSNYGTIQEAIDAATAGDTIIVTGGPYYENIIVDKQLTVTGIGLPVINGTGKDNDAVRLETDNVVFEGFEVRDADYAGIYVRLNNDTVVRNNRVLSSGYFGLYVRGSDGAIISNNTFNNNDMEGIRVYTSTDCSVYNNTCDSNDGSGIYLLDSLNCVVYYNDLNNYNDDTGEYYNAAEAGTSPSTNRWYNESLMRGNRYSDYDGTDDNSDGIGDSPYIIADIEGPVINSDLYPLMPTGPVLQPAPTITGISVSGITAESATVGWTIGNGVESSNRVLYGTDADLAGAVWSAWDNATTAPSILLSGLTGNTQYYYRCYSQRADDGDRTTLSSINSFTTLERPPAVITVDDDDSDIPVPPADFQTITDALAASIDGDTILVYAGDYSGYHEVQSQVNLTGIGWPEVSGDPDNTLDELGDVFALRADGCILDGFVIRDGWWNNQSGYSTTTDSAGVRVGYLSAPADDLIIRNNRIEDSKYGIIANPLSNNNTIQNNTVKSTYYGVWLNYARNTLFANNTVTNNYFGVFRNTYRTSTTTTYATNNRIEYNTFDAAGWTPFGYDDSYGREVEIDYTGGNILSHNTLLNQTYIQILGGDNIIEDNRLLGPCDGYFSGIRIFEDGNTVNNNTVGNHKFGILITEQADNLRMSGNTIAGCTYGFGFDGDVAYAGSRPLRYVIDTTNTVEGNPVYWIVGETGQVYNYSTLSPGPGYLALIDCSDIRVEDFYLEKNAQSFFIYRSTDVTLDSVTAHGNAFQGILVGDSDGITITDAGTDSNGEDMVDGSRQAGIWANEMTGSRIVNATVSANNPAGITFWYDCADNLISAGSITNNGHSTDAEESYGIRENGGSNLTVTGCTIGNTFADRQGIGVFTYADDSLFYNNRFFNHTVANARNYGDGTRWNVTPVAGTNILGGPWTAGNSWDDYAGMDLNSDGLGDTELPYTTGGAAPGGDHHPLLDTFIPDTDPPVIIVSSPLEGETYPSAAVPLEVSSPDADVALWWYSLDSGANVTFVPDTTLTSLTVGPHTLQVWARDTSENENSSVVNFTAEMDTTPPVLYVTTPEENATYTTRDIPLSVWSPDVDAFSWWHALDGGANSTPISPAVGTTLTGLANGNHIVAVFMDDIVGNTNMTSVNFTVNATTPTPSPIIPGRDDSTDPVDYPLPDVEEEPAFLITILTPDPGQTVERQAEVTYAADAPLARAYYQLDGGAYVQVRPGRAIPVDRLTLGTHEITVTGVDYYGRYGQGSVSFEVIALAIGEGEPLGTPSYPDDAAVSFTGRAVNYTLSFEVRTVAEEEVSVYLNRRLAGVPGGETSIVPAARSGGLLENVSSVSPGVWTRVTIPVPADRVVSGSENIISLVHTENPSRTGDLVTWNVRDVALVPDIPASAPSIRVFTPDQALGPDDEMMVWVEIAGIAPEDRYTARVYLVAPDGEVISFPAGSGDAVPLDDAYVRSNHYGRLPGSIAFAAADIPGTYRLAATLEPEGSGQLVSLSSVPVFFNSVPAVRLYGARDMLTDGMPLLVMHAATGGTLAEEETLIIVMEHPDGSTTYLPGASETYASRRFAPLGSLFETVLDETVDAGWGEGTYLIRSMLYNSTDALVAQDIVTFTVAREEGELTLSFPPSVAGGMPSSSRIRLIDAVSLATVAEQETGTAHDEVIFSVPAGTYWYSGQLTTETGETVIIPVDPANRVSILPGGNVFRQVVVQTGTTPSPAEVTL